MRKSDRPLRIDGAVYPEDAYEAGLTVSREFPYNKRPKAFADAPLLVGSACVLYMSGMSKREIQRALSIKDVRTVNKYLAMGRKMYPDMAEHLT